LHRLVSSQKKHDLQILFEYILLVGLSLLMHSSNMDEALPLEEAFTKWVESGDNLKKSINKLFEVL